MHESEKALMQSMPKLLSTTLHAVAMLTLHLTRKAKLTPDQVKHFAEILNLFLEALDDSVSSDVP